ncbi:DNA repair protein RadA [Levilactobacillus brevis]|nr:DNA repair protein RadA [Levilactobacillus brevis]
MVEEVVTPAAAKPQSTRTTASGERSHPQLMSEIKHSTESRTKTQMEELNRVLGGGIVPGSLILIGGDPGIGKSTLLLQVSGQLSQTGGKVLYVSGEESASQIKMRADRLVVNATTCIFIQKLIWPVFARTLNR